jgi:hypothetical protein
MTGDRQTLVEDRDVTGFDTRWDCKCHSQENEGVECGHPVLEYGHVHIRIPHVSTEVPTYLTLRDRTPTTSINIVT